MICPRGKDCIRRTPELGWDFQNRYNEHRIQNVYNRSKKCVLHTKSANLLSVKRRCGITDILSNLATCLRPTELNKPGDLQISTKGDVYRHLNAHCAVSTALKMPFLGKRSEVKISEIMPDYLRNQKSICVKCANAETLTKVLDYLAKNKCMRPLPPEFKRLLLMGGTLNPNWAQRTDRRNAPDLVEASTHSTAVHADVSKLCTPAAAKDDVLITGRFGTVAFAKRLTEHLYDEFNQKKRSKRPKVMKQTKDSSEGLLRTQQLKRLIAVPEAGQQKTHDADGEKPHLLVTQPKDVYSSYLEQALGHNGQTRRKSLLQLARQSQILIGEPGDVWFQMQKDGQGVKEANELPFAAPYYPPHLNPKLADVPTAKEAAREHAQNRLLGCAMKTPKSRLDIRTYVNGLTTDSAKSHFPVSVDYTCRGPGQVSPKEAGNVIQVPKPTEENVSNRRVMQSYSGGDHRLPVRKSCLNDVSNNSIKGAFTCKVSNRRHSQSPGQCMHIHKREQEMHTQQKQSQQATDSQEREKRCKGSLVKVYTVRRNQSKKTKSCGPEIGGASGRTRKSVTFDSNQTKSEDDSRKNRTKNKSIRRRVGYAEPKEPTTSNLTASNKANAYKLPRACRAVQRKSILATMRELDNDNPGLLDAYLEWRQEQSAEQEEFWRKSCWKIQKHKKAKDSMDKTPNQEMTFEASEKHCW